MAATLDRPPSPPRPPRQNPDAADPTPPALPRHTRNWVQRYQSHLLVGGLSVVVTAIALSPLILGSMSRSGPPTAPVSARTTTTTPANLTSNVAMTASEFKFTPTSAQVPVGQKVTFTLTNTGVVEHDLTIPGTGFAISANAGQTTTGEFTFDKPGVFDFFCSIPGHKDAGMKGTLTVVDPSAAAPAVQLASAPSSSMADMPGMSTSTASRPDIQPLPANLKSLPPPQVDRPPIALRQPM